MSAPLSPPLRALRARRALAAALGLAMLSALLSVAARVLPAPAAAGRPRAPAAVDLARDPAWRLRMLPGVGTVRARALERARSGLPPQADAAALLARAGLPRALLEAWCRPDAPLRVLLDGRALRGAQVPCGR